MYHFLNIMIRIQFLIPAQSDNETGNPAGFIRVFIDIGIDTADKIPCLLQKGVICAFRISVHKDDRLKDPAQAAAGPETKNVSTAGSTVSASSGRDMNRKKRPLDISMSGCSQKYSPRRVI